MPTLAAPGTVRGAARLGGSCVRPPSGDASRERREAYLQVHPDNLAAQALYAGEGFATHHSYSYWEAPR